MAIQRPEERNINLSAATPSLSLNNTQNSTNPDEIIDLDGDGMISKNEQDIYEKKAKNRRGMAWISLIAMVVSGISLMFLVPESRLQKLNAMLDLYWISLGGIVGAYVGISSWMSKK